MTKPETIFNAFPAVKLMEECSEVIKATSKMIQHGPDNHDPKDPLQITNWTALQMEVGDVLAWAKVLGMDLDELIVLRDMKLEALKNKGVIK